MQVLRCRGVNEAFERGVALLRNEGKVEDSRAGRVLVHPEPVTTVYERPLERVLFREDRDANPFFHLMEALWMLEGRHDGAWLDQFVSDFSSRFAEQDGNIHGAYGFRWRNHFGYDQLDSIVQKLRHNPQDRQAVLAMWDACFTHSFDDDPCGAEDLRGDWKDRPCNTHAYFRVVQDTPPRLNMTVCCRSNDIIWGAYGANAVHFSVLQEYLAAKVGVGLGTYTQISNNYHAYLDQLEKIGDAELVGFYSDPFGVFSATPTAVFDTPDFDDCLHAFFVGDRANSCRSTFFTRVAWPMFDAYELWRSGHKAKARAHLRLMPHWLDWYVASAAWMDRRLIKQKVTA